MFRTTKSRNLLPAVAMSAALLLSACSSEGGAQDEGDTDTPPLTIAMITHSAAGDTFWDIVRSGAETAAEKSNVTLNYYSDPDGAGQAALVQNAVDSGVDGIAVTLAKPDAMRGALDAAAAKGIPVVGLNAGIEHWSDAGLLEFFGLDETIAGTAFGQRLNDVGAKHTVCVIHEQGNVALEERCSALDAAYDGEVETLYVDNANMPDVKATITSKLQSDPSIDFVASLAAPIAMTAVQAIADAGSAAQLATFDTNSELVAAIKDGTVQWAVDQQPYLQGYLAVDALWLYRTNGNVIGGTQPVLTGPAFVDASNVDAVAAFAEKGTR